MVERMSGAGMSFRAKRGIWIIGRGGIRRVAVALAIGIATASPSRSQARPYTLDDVLTSLRRGADTLDLARVNPVQNQALDSVTIMLRTAGAAALTIDDLAAIVTKTHASLSDVARWNPQPHAAWAEPWFYDALVRLRRIANAAGTGIGPRLVTAFGAQVADHFIAPMDELETKILQSAQAKNAEKLRRYEIKYGPQSARLNIAEVLINYVLARPSWSPLAPDENGPSPIELVAMYSTSDLTGSRSADDKFRPHVVGGAYAGVRYYRFGAPDENVGRIKAFLRPQHLGIGAFFMGSTDRALISPFENGHRTGGFLEWGIARAGVAVGDEWRVVIGVGKQILPYLF
jgi:hypothetical protein